MRDDTTGLFKVAGWCAYLGAVVSAAGILFLVLLYVGIFSGDERLIGFGILNDLCVLVQYALLLPIVIVFHRILRSQSPRLVLLMTLIAVVGIIGVIVFQYFLIAGIMPFSEQVVYVSVFILMVGAWITVAGVIGRRSGKLSQSVAEIILAALYFGYPIWVYRVGRQLRSKNHAIIN